MKTSNFEKLGIKSSLLGFGCMRFPTLTNGNIDELEAEKNDGSCDKQWCNVH